MMLVCIIREFEFVLFVALEIHREKRSQSVLKQIMTAIVKHRNKYVRVVERARTLITDPHDVILIHRSL